MRIALVDYSGHPFQAQLARALAGRGHEVQHLHFAEFQTPKGRLSFTPGDPQGLSFKAVSLGKPFAKHHIVKRRFQEIQAGKLFADHLASFKPDVVIASNLPLDALRVMQDKALALGATFIFWQQDIYSDAIARILKQKFSLAGSAVGLWYRALERRLLERSDAAVVISDAFTEHNRNKLGVRNLPIHVIENWAPLDEITPRPKDNPWARAHDLHDKTVILYTGTLGMKHDPSLILTLAESFQDRPDFRMVVTSEGPAVDWLRRKKDERSLSSLVLLGFQPFDAYPDVLGTGDILLSILEEEAGAFSVPSKVLSYLCSERPVLFHGPSNNLAARILKREGAGCVCSHDETETFPELARRLIDTPALRQDMGGCGRKYAEKAFRVSTIADKFEAIFGA